MGHSGLFSIIIDNFDDGLYSLSLWLNTLPFYLCQDNPVACW